jgi:hypothetical protein
MASEADCFRAVRDSDSAREFFGSVLVGANFREQNLDILNLRPHRRSRRKEK